ncbi:MAG TPA: lipase [Opitutae bacterium]|nr:lipase [Opitutaceae bacterium]HCR29900.1 lipase [Opitutae bacterium]
MLLRSIAILTSLFALNFAEGADPWNLQKDIPFAQANGRPIQLDIYSPLKKPRDGVIVWIHGGAWRRGSKENPPILALVEKGWPIASIEYRLSEEARFPAQMHDIKAAIRFLRAKQQEYGLRAKRVFIFGASAGGHLAALAGVTNGVEELEGFATDNREQSSDIQGIVSLYGASNLTTILDQSTPHGLGVRVPALELFIGGRPESVPSAARQASPVFHVDKDDPPLLMIHGDQDPQMPINQSIELLGKYEEFDLDVSFVPLHGAKHGGKAFYDDEHTEMMHKFLMGIR